jgi:hypothetical protein
MLWLIFTIQAKLTSHHTHLFVQVKSSNSNYVDMCIDLACKLCVIIVLLIFLFGTFLAAFCFGFFSLSAYIHLSGRVGQMGMVATLTFAWPRSTYDWLRDYQEAHVVHRNEVIQCAFG